MESKTLESLPAPDEVEVSLFGPGIGESLAIHLGAGEWIIVDSCIDPHTREPVALAYLKKLGVTIASAVKLLVVTHWHNDHMRGASKIFEAAESATVVCSSALQRAQFAELIAAYERDSLSGDNELSEFSEILRILKSRSTGSNVMTNGPVWAVEGRTLYRRESSSICGVAQVDALSPCDAALRLAHLEFAQFLPQYHKTKLSPVAISPNKVSIVLWLRIGSARVLLGGDLEESGDPLLGWRAILGSNVREAAAACAFKVPHHGSANAHSNDVWEQMLAKSCTAALTPFRRGRSPLPSSSDIERIKTKTHELYATCPPGGWRSPRRDRAVERILGKRLRALTGRMGHVRIRFSSANPAMPLNVELFSGATRL